MAHEVKMIKTIHKENTLEGKGEIKYLDLLYGKTFETGGQDIKKLTYARMYFLDGHALHIERLSLFLFCIELKNWLQEMT